MDYSSLAMKSGHESQPLLQKCLESDRRVDDRCSKPSSDVVRDIIIGFADGLTVPFALTAGLSTLGSTKLVVMGGLAELFSGSISMGLGAYLAAVTERERYLCEEERERAEQVHKSGPASEEIHDILQQYGISRTVSEQVVDNLAQNPECWVQFKMDLGLKLEKPNCFRAWISAATMGLSYFIGGLIPMIPYFALPNVMNALFVSIAITVVVLLAFGFVKNWVTVRTAKSGFNGALQTLCVGALAAGASFVIVRTLDTSDTNMFFS